MIASLSWAALGSDGAPNESSSVNLRERNGEKRLLPPKGLIIYKRHIQADEHAPVIEYAAVRPQAGAIDMTRQGGGFVSIPRNQLVKHIVYPKMDADLQSEEQLDRRKTTFAEYRHLAKRFNRAAPYLQPLIIQFEHEVQMWTQGNCRLDGAWIDRYDLQVAKLRAEFEKKRAQILGTPSTEQSDQFDRFAPLWSVALEHQIRADEKEKRDADNKKKEAQRNRRSRRFHDSAEDDRPFGTPWRIR
jgi:hypothetical protein